VFERWGTTSLIIDLLILMRFHLHDAQTRSTWSHYYCTQSTRCSFCVSVPRKTGIVLPSRQVHSREKSSDTPDVSNVPKLHPSRRSEGSVRCEGTILQGRKRKNDRRKSHRNVYRSGRRIEEMKTWSSEESEEVRETRSLSDTPRMTRG